MEKFKETLQNRIKVLVLFNLLVVLFCSFGALGYFKFVGNEHISDAIAGFQAGVFFGIQITLLPKIFKYRRAIKDNENLKLLYIEENDERKNFIKSKIGETSLNISLSGIAFASILAGFFNEIVCLTLVGAFSFLAIVKGFLKLYYNKKY